MKIVLINHTYQINYYTRRWQLLAESHPDLDVTLLAPSKIKWYHRKDYSYGDSKVMIGKTVEKGNFHIRLFTPMFKHTWLSSDFKRILVDIKPDIIYHVGFHTQPTLVQIGQIVRRLLPGCKLVLFSMRGPAFNLDRMSGVKKLYSRFVVNYINKFYNAIFCHYPVAVDCFRKEGYRGPIYMQTQVGVNPEWFHPDNAARQEIREKYNLGDSFVFGSASRFSSDKGIDDILAALPEEGDWKYLMMGTGPIEDINRLKATISSRGLEDKVIMTGFVDWYDIAKYWNAVDCAVHVPRTTNHWEETFSLAVVQPMITGKPIIGNTSGSVPYQIGEEGIIVEEGDILALRKTMVWAMSDEEGLHSVASKMYSRAMNCFSIQHLNDVFYDTIVDVRDGVIDPSKFDMTQYKVHE